MPTKNPENTPFIIQDSPNLIRENYPNERRYQAAYALANEFHVCSDDEREKKEKAKLFRSESMQEQEYHIRLKRPSLY